MWGLKRQKLQYRLKRVPTFLPARGTLRRMRGDLMSGDDSRDFAACFMSSIGICLLSSITPQPKMKPLQECYQITIAAQWQCQLSVGKQGLFDDLHTSQTLSTACQLSVSVLQTAFQRKAEFVRHWTRITLFKDEKVWWSIMESQLNYYLITCLPINLAALAYIQLSCAVMLPLCEHWQHDSSATQQAPLCGRSLLELQLFRAGKSKSTRAAEPAAAGVEAASWAPHGEERAVCGMCQLNYVWLLDKLWYRRYMRKRLLKPVDDTVYI